jgi:hypothetical protein
MQTAFKESSDAEGDGRAAGGADWWRQKHAVT